jgi:hybrid cluster-associated redox disulfide protein
MKITSKTKISKIIEQNPDAILVLMEYGLLCAGCQFAGNHGLDETKKLYGFTDKDIKEMLKKINDLNKKVAKKKLALAKPS